MFFLVDQNNDLCNVSGFAFTDRAEALDCASKHLGVVVKAVPAEVRVQNGPTFPCDVVVPRDGPPDFCREGHMTLIAQLDDALAIAMYLTRRNRINGCGQVVFDKAKANR